MVYSYRHTESLGRMELETNRAKDVGWGYYQGWRTKDDVRPAEQGAKGARPAEQEGEGCTSYGAASQERRWHSLNCVVLISAARL